MIEQELILYGVFTIVSRHPHIPVAMFEHEDHASNWKDRHYPKGGRIHPIKVKAAVEVPSHTD